MRLIDAEVLQKHLDDVIHDELCDPDYKKVCFPISIYVDGMPTIEVEPVRHGKWRTGNRAPAPIDRFVCSVCDGLVVVSTFRNRCMYNYCPHCGAKMDGGDSS